MITARKGLFLVALVLLACSVLNARWTSWLTRPVTGTVDTLQWPAGWVASNFKTDPAVDRPAYSDDELHELLDKADKYNAELWAENAELREQLEAFEAIARIRDIKAIRLVQAEVAFYDADRTNPSMKLLRGSLHGITQDDAVAYKQNLIGFVDEVAPITSTVRLVTGPDYRSEVMIMPPGQVREGNGWPFITRVESDGKGGFFCDLKHAVADSLRAGDVVRVRDSLRRSANGFVLGQVASIEEHPTDPRNLKRVVVTPNTPIGPQSEVTVITDRVD